MNLIEALLALARSSGSLTLEEARRIYRHMLWFLTYPVGLVLIGYGLNLYGLLGVNIILTVILAGGAFAIWMEPGIVFTISGAEAVISIADKTTRSHIVEEVKKIFFKDGWYLAVLKNIFLGSTFLFYVLGTLPFHKNPMAFFGLLGATIVVGAFIWKWPTVFSGHKGKRIAFGYAVVTLVFWVLSLVPGPVWVKYMPYGWDPATIKPTSTEDALYRLKHARQDIADADRAKELERITDKVNRREALTRAEEQFIAYAQSVEQQKQTKTTQAQGCPQYGSTKDEECMVTVEGIILSTRETMHPGEFELCNVLPNGGTLRSEWVDSSTLKLASTTGAPFPIQYKLIKRDALVNGECPKMF